MTAFIRKKVSVVFLNEPDFEDLALKFLVLNLNKIQQCFEFEFPEFDDYPMETEDYVKAGIPIAKFVNIVEEEHLDGDYFIGIVGGSIGQNWFWVASGNFAIITTADWNKMFTPPSVLEYIIHCIVAVLIIMSDKTDTLHSHHPTRGCCLDYTYLKEEDKVDIALGYICSDCKTKIRERIGDNYVECFEKMNNREWLGEVGEKGTTAHDLKKYFKVDLNKDTGFYKTRRDKMKEYLLGLSKEMTSLAIAILVGAILGFIIGSLLGKG
jgi:hypothetical protein